MAQDDLGALERKLAANPGDLLLQEQYDRARERLGLAPEIIYFVYRHPHVPFGKRVVTLRAKSILEWFQWLWREVDRLGPEQSDFELFERLLKGDVYTFENIYIDIHENSKPYPEYLGDLKGLLASVYHNEIRASEHAVRVLSDDDDYDLCYSFFSAQCARKYPERVAYLLHEEVALPTDWTVGSFKEPFEMFATFEAQAGEGTVYFVDLDMDEIDYLDTVNVSKLQGARLSDLESVMAKSSTDDMGTHLFGFVESVHEGKTLEETWREIGEGLKLDFSFTEHFAQIGSRFFLFDDYWAAAHPELATSLLYAANCWDPFEGLSLEDLSGTLRL